MKMMGIVLIIYIVDPPSLKTNWVFSTFTVIVLTALSLCFVTDGNDKKLNSEVVNRMNFFSGQRFGCCCVLVLQNKFFLGFWR